jgi:hypothetical protein
MDNSSTLLVMAAIAVTAIYYICVRKLSPAAKQPQSGSEAHNNRP